MSLPGLQALRAMKPSKAALLGTLAFALVAGVLVSQRYSPSASPRVAAAMYMPDVFSPARAEASADASPAAPPKRAGLVEAGPAQEAMAASKRLIRSGNLSLEVTSFDAAFSRIQTIAAECGGYVSDIQAGRHDGGPASGTITLRVQADRYFQALDSLRPLGKVEKEGVSTQDITRQFADLEARLRNKRELEARMREILRTRSSRMEDLLQGENQLAQVTGEIEQMEGERRYYQQVSALSTLTLEVHEPLVAPVAEPKTFDPVRAAFKSGLESIVASMAVMVSVLTLLLPWSLLALLGWGLFRRFRAAGSHP